MSDKVARRRDGKRAVDVSTEQLRNYIEDASKLQKAKSRRNTRRFFIASALIVLVGVIAGAIGARAEDPVVAACKQAVTEELGYESPSWKVTENIKQPLAFDLFGEWDLGTWTCSGTKEPLEVLNVQILP